MKEITFLAIFSLSAVLFFVGFGDSIKKNYLASEVCDVEDLPDDFFSTEDSVLPDGCKAINVSELFDEKVKEKKVAKYIMENIQKDYLDCYSFYKVASESFKKAGKDQGLITNLESLRKYSVVQKQPVFSKGFNVYLKGFAPMPPAPLVWKCGCEVAKWRSGEVYRRIAVVKWRSGDGLRRLPGGTAGQEAPQEVPEAKIFPNVAF